MPAVQWEIGQVKTRRKGAGEITNKNSELSWIKLAIDVGDFTALCPFSSSFDLSNLALDRIVWNKTEADKNTCSPIWDWTSQNRKKRDGSWAEFNWAELGWIERNWAELSWIELSSAEFCWVELVWVELSWAEQLSNGRLDKSKLDEKGREK